MVCSVKDQVLAHDGQANKAEISSSNMVSIVRLFGEVRGSASGPAYIDPGKAHAAGRKDLWSGMFE